ncbi:hypothetical protein RMCBS344292_15823 [Rhizopus microsporus]|nr:hypothetical protein RMCBS344292_15823 [Rhizopus microsporus]
MFDTQSNKLKLKTGSVTFPDSINKFLNPFDIYNEFSEALIWDDRITYDHKEVIETKVFKSVGERFVHSILTDTNIKHWLLLTEVDIFLPNKKNIDSCSYDLESTELSKFTIKISKDKNQGRRYSELTVQAGCFQILSTGGIYRNQDTLLGGFLGSSIPSNSTHEYNTCYTLRQPKESRCFYRLLRDYSKPDASYFAGFRSAIFTDHGFQGAHPLRYYQDEKPGVANLSVIASKIICNYINKRAGKNDIIEYLRLFLKTKVVKEISNERLKTVATVADMGRLVKDNTVQLGNYASTILYKMKIMEEAVGDTLDPIDITIFDLESTNDKNTKLRDLVNGGLYDSVKKQNGKTGFSLTY